MIGGRSRSRRRGGGRVELDEVGGGTGLDEVDGGTGLDGGGGGTGLDGGGGGTGLDEGAGMLELVVGHTGFRPLSEGEGTEEKWFNWIFLLFVSNLSINDTVALLFSSNCFRDASALLFISANAVVKSSTIAL